MGNGIRGAASPSITQTSARNLEGSLDVSEQEISPADDRSASPRDGKHARPRGPKTPSDRGRSPSSTARANADWLSGVTTRLRHGSSSDRKAELGAGAAAVRNYGNEAKQKTSYDLGNRQSTLALIRKSPQIDNLKRTTTDAARCGAACVFNGLLLDGDYKSNAAALIKLASGLSLPLSRQDKAALAAFRRGRMRPAHAAQLQDLTYRLAKSNSGPTSSRAGLNERDVANLVSSLCLSGAFPNTKTISLRNNRSSGTTSGHWTLSHQTNKGHGAFVDPWPRASGEASAGPAAMAEDKGAIVGTIGHQRHNPHFKVRVDITPGKTKTSFRFRYPHRARDHDNSGPGAMRYGYKERRLTRLTGQQLDTKAIKPNKPVLITSS